MIDTQSYIGVSSHVEKLTWTRVICAIGLDFATCLLSHGILVIPFAFYLLGALNGIVLTVALCALAAYSFYCLHRVMESKPSQRVNVSLKRMSLAFLTELSLGTRGAMFVKNLEFIDTILSGVYLFALLCLEIHVLFPSWSYSSVVLLIVTISAFFGFSNEPDFFFSAKWWATPLCFALIFAGMILSACEWSWGLASAFPFLPVAFSTGLEGVPSGVDTDNDELGANMFLDQTYQAGSLLNLPLAFGILIHCLAGASTAPGMYTYLVSASRRVKLDALTVAALADSAEERGRKDGHGEYEEGIDDKKGGGSTLRNRNQHGKDKDTDKAKAKAPQSHQTTRRKAGGKAGTEGPSVAQNGADSVRVPRPVNAEEFILKRNAATANFFLSKSKWVMIAGMGVVACVYTLFGCIGFLLHGKTIQPSLALNMIFNFNHQYATFRGLLGESDLAAAAAPGLGLLLMSFSIAVVFYQNMSVLPLVVCALDRAVISEKMTFRQKAARRVIIVVCYGTLGYLIKGKLIALVALCGSMVVAVLTFVLPLLVHLHCNFHEISFIERGLGVVFLLCVLLLQISSVLQSVAPAVYMGLVGKAV